MRRPYYRKTDTTGPKRERDAPSSMQDLRVRILNIMLTGAAVVGLVVLGANLIVNIPLRNWGVVIVSVTSYLWILWITIDRKLPYLVRAIGFVVLPFMLGVAAQLQYGIAGDSRVWLLGFSALTAIILGLKAGIGAIILSLITQFGSIILVNQQIIRTPEPAMTPATADILDWLSVGSVWLIIAGVVMVTSTLLIQGLTNSLEKERSLSKLLELDREHKDRRTRELDRRLVQIRTAAEVSRSLSGLMDLDTLLQQVVDLMQSRFGLYYVGVFLQDEKGENAILRAGTGEAGEEMIATRYQMPVGDDSIVGRAIANRKPHIALDVGREPTRFNNPLLPKTRSEMALPLISGERVFGALTVQSEFPDAFDQDDTIVMQGIADSLATSIQNVHLFDESKKSLQEIQALNRQYVVQAWKKAGETPSLQRASYENAAYDGIENISITQRFPILLRDQIIGQLAIDTDKQMLTPEEQTLIQEVTTQAALAMENIRLLEESQRRSSLEHLLGNVVQNVRSQTDLEMILRSTVSELGRALGATTGVIYLTPEFLEPTPTAPSTPDNGRNDSSDENA
jgi:GAF domain-containing protein